MEKYLRTIFCVVFLMVSFFPAKLTAQAKLECKVIFLLKGEGKPVEIVSPHGFLEYNYQTGFFSFSVNLSTLKAQDNNSDTLFSKVEDKFMHFEGNSNVNFAKFQDEEKFKENDYPLEGNLFLNGVKQPITGKYTPLNKLNFYKDQRINLYFNIYPADFGLDIGKIKKIEVLIPDGYLNNP